MPSSRLKRENSSQTGGDFLDDDGEERLLDWDVDKRLESLDVESRAPLGAGWPGRLAAHGPDCIETAMSWRTADVDRCLSQDGRLVGTAVCLLLVALQTQEEGLDQADESVVAWLTSNYGTPDPPLSNATRGVEPASAPGYVSLRSVMKSRSASAAVSLDTRRGHAVRRARPSNDAAWSGSPVDPQMGRLLCVGPGSAGSSRIGNGLADAVGLDSTIFQEWSC